MLVRRLMSTSDQDRNFRTLGKIETKNRGQLPRFMHNFLVEGRPFKADMLLLLTYTKSHMGFLFALWRTVYYVNYLSKASQWSSIQFKQLSTQQNNLTFTLVFITPF